MDGSARLDSGAEAILLRESTVESHKLATSTGTETTIMFGNGQTSATDLEANLGNLKAIVCKDADLHEDLISVNPLLDIGFKLTMEHDCGILEHERTGATITVRRDGARWSVDLDDLARATQEVPMLEGHHSIQKLVEANAALYVEPPSIREKVISLHERMGHANAEAMCDAISGDSPSWTHSDLSPAQVRRVMKRHRCLICLLAKRPRPTISPPSGDRRDLPPGYCISGDIIPVSPPAHDGSTMFFLFADVRTGYLLAYTGKAKDSFLEAFKQAVSHFERWGHKVRAFRSDAETVLKDGKMGEYLKANGFVHELSTPDAHYQNFVERYVQTVNKFTAALLNGQDILQSKHWNWALFHAIDCRNRVPNSKCRPSSPYEVITGYKTNLKKTFQFTFGDLVAVHLPKDKRNWKFDLRWDVGVYVGQPEHSVEASLVYFPYKNQLLVRTDVAKLNITEETYKRFYFKRYDMAENPASTATRIVRRLDEIQFDFDKPLEQDANDSETIPMNAPLVEPDEVPIELQTDSNKRRRKDWGFLPEPRVTRSKAKDQNPSVEDMIDDAVRAFSAAVKAFAAKASGPEVKEALDSGIRDQWIMAMADEIIENMIKSTRTLVPEDIDFSKPYHLIHTTMQLKIKMKTDTIIDKLKAKGCAPVVMSCKRSITRRILLPFQASPMRSCCKLPFMTACIFNLSTPRPRTCVRNTHRMLPPCISSFRREWPTRSVWILSRLIAFEDIFMDYLMPAARIMTPIPSI